MKRRTFLSATIKSALASGAFALGPAGLIAWSRKVGADPQTIGLPPNLINLSDPALQPKFVNLAPNALDPGFKYYPKKGKIKIAAMQAVQMTGLVDTNGIPVPTTVWGYGESGVGVTWPGRTFEVQSGQALDIKWENKLVDPVSDLPLPHLLPVDTSMHWCYSLHGYETASIANDGVPLVPHLHGGHTQDIFDGNPEYFFSPGWGVRGPRWVEKTYTYDNDQGAGTLWYHDHALGITRLNVYAGLAGFYFVRDDDDTGKPDNPLGLPAGPYELAYAIQDRMFYNTGELFYPAYPGDPFYADFITDEGAELPEDLFPGGGPTGLAEFFGDHMVVNGLIWPKAEVEPRNYRMRLLNGTDSRFMVVRFRAVPLGDTDFTNASDPIPFRVIGSDQGLASRATLTDTLVFEPGSRYDVVFNFRGLRGQRIIMENIGGDAPFGGDFGDDLTEDDFFANRQTDRIMAFDVVKKRDRNVPDNYRSREIHQYEGNSEAVTRVRKVALFEGMDEFGRLQPLLGTAGPAFDNSGNPILGKDGHQLEGSIGWHEATTENPDVDDTEIWEIYNATGDAHPVHLHLVRFEILNRREFTADTIEQPILQHNGAVGLGFRLENIVKGARVRLKAADGYVENAPKDMVTALPGQVTRIKATFDRPGRYVWHCHILSHEDHEMMRVLHVGPGA